MADLEEEQRKYEDALRNATREIQRNGSVTSETNERLKETNKLYAAMKTTLAGTSKALGSGLKQAGLGAANVAASFARGNRTFDSLIPIVDAVGNSISAVVGALPLAGGALAGMTKGVSEAAKIMIGKMGELNTGFDAVGKSGALGADGATGLGRQFTRAGLSIQQYSEVTTRNSRALAAMGGSAFQGAEKFSKTVGDLTQGPLSMSIRTLGYSAEDIGEVTGNFMTQQTRLGMSQGMSQRQLAAGTAQYVKELDSLSKLTGQNAKELQDQSLAIQMETQFRSKQEQMISEQGEAGREAARRLEMFSQSMGKYDPSGQIGAQIREIFATGGAPITEGAQSLMTATNGAIGPIIEQVKNGTLSMDEALGQVRGALNDNKTMLTTAGTITMEGSNVINQGTLPALYNLMNGTETAAKAIESTQKKQTEATDAITIGLKTTQKNIEGMNVEMDKLFLNAMPAASTITKGFTDAMLSGVKKMNEFLEDTDWEKMKRIMSGEEESETKNKILDWTKIGGGITAAAGALMTATGVLAPLGIGMMAAGVSIAAGAEALDTRERKGAEIFYNPPETKGADALDTKEQKGTKKRALGGPVMSGQPYLVGENGPELFMPKVSGKVMAGPSLASQRASMMKQTPTFSEETQQAAINNATTGAEDNKLMVQQNEKLDELISVVKQTKNIQGKMLSASYS